MKKIKSDSMEIGMDAVMTPSFCASEEQIPEIRSWKVGGKYEICIEVELKRLSKVGGKIEGSFDILSYEPEGEDYSDLSDEQMELEQAKGLSSKK